MKASARIKEKRSAVFHLQTSSTKSEQWPFAVHPYTAHYRIFALQKYAAAVLRCDTASMPCIEGVSRATCNEREARSFPRDLQRARSAKFPAQDLLTYLTVQSFLDANRTLALYTVQRICTENNKQCRIKPTIKRSLKN